MSRKHYTPERFRPHKFGLPKRKAKTWKPIPLSPAQHAIAAAIEGTFVEVTVNGQKITSMRSIDYAEAERRAIAYDTGDLLDSMTYAMKGIKPDQIIHDELIYSVPAKTGTAEEIRAAMERFKKEMVERKPIPLPKTSYSLADIRRAIENHRRPDSEAFRVAERRARDLYPELLAESDRMAETVTFPIGNYKPAMDGRPVKHPYADLLPVEVTPPAPWWAQFGQTFEEALERAPFEVLRRVAGRIKFGLLIGPTFGFELRIEDRSWFGVADTLDLVVNMKVLDRLWPHSPSSINAGFPIPRTTWRYWKTERDAAKWIRDQVASLLVHELDESLTVDGDRMFDPHNPIKKIPGAL